MAGRVLVVEDDPGVLDLEEGILREAGFRVARASTGEEARRQFREAAPVAVVLDLNLPDVRGRSLLDEFHRERPEVPVVIVTGEGGVSDAVDCMRSGAYDFLQKPFEGPRLVTTLRNALERCRLLERVESLATELHGTRGFETILGDSPAMKSAVALLRRAAASDVTVLLEGESGTGKEVAARAVHAEGRRRTGPFVAVNCGAIPENLVEAELFGHEKGAFTGATSARPGLFVRADGGTVLLDEIGELRPEFQVKLLRVLQEGEVVPVGGAAARSVDVRVVAATNRDLRAEVGAKRFRDDLYYRLAVFPVRLPPLRERGGDIELLAESFLRLYSERHGRKVRRFSDEARLALGAYRWPGNVRELQNVIERATIVEDGDSISLASLPDPIVETLDAGPEGPAPGVPASVPPEAVRREDPVPGGGTIEPLEEMERHAVLRALHITGWQVREAATRLGVGRATLYRKIEQYGFRPDAPPS